MVHLPNVRALNRALRDAPWSALCYLRIPGMEMLVKNYGIMLRIQYKQKLSHWLSPLLEPGEDVYQLSGNDLALHLNTESHQERITALDSHLKQFRFLLGWNADAFADWRQLLLCALASESYLPAAGES